jgi:hypothetical protein
MYVQMESFDMWGAGSQRPHLEWGSLVSWEEVAGDRILNRGRKDTYLNNFTRQD